MYGVQETLQFRKLEESKKWIVDYFSKKLIYYFYDN